MTALSYNMAWTTGHSVFPPTQIIASQAKVFVGGLPVLVDQDKIIPHTHEGFCQPRTSKVFIGGKKAVQIGDNISCGDHVAQGSPKVFIG